MDVRGSGLVGVRSASVVALSHIPAGVRDVPAVRRPSRRGTGDHPQLHSRRARGVQHRRLLCLDTRGAGELGLGRRVLQPAGRRMSRRSDACHRHGRLRDLPSRTLPPDHRAVCRAFFVHVADSRHFLRECPGSIDLLYLDTGDITPLEPTAELQLAEARLLVERELVPRGGVILIDDVQNQTPRAFGEQSDLGKAKYSLPFLLAHGFRIEMSEYQCLLVREA